MMNMIIYPCSIAKLIHVSKKGLSNGSRNRFSIRLVIERSRSISSYVLANILLWMCWRCLISRCVMVMPDLLPKSHNAPLPYPTMHHFVTGMCTRVHVSVIKMCGNCLVHCEICEMSLFFVHWAAHRTNTPKIQMLPNIASILIHFWYFARIGLQTYSYCMPAICLSILSVSRSSFDKLHANEIDWYKLQVHRLSEICWEFEALWLAVCWSAKSQVTRTLSDN